MRWGLLVECLVDKAIKSVQGLRQHAEFYNSALD
jgi:hypothetical protein